MDLERLVGVGLTCGAKGLERRALPIARGEEER